jgi:hypothetical protein
MLPQTGQVELRELSAEKEGTQSADLASGIPATVSPARGSEIPVRKWPHAHVLHNVPGAKLESGVEAADSWLDLVNEEAIIVDRVCS